MKVNSLLKTNEHPLYLKYPRYPYEPHRRSFKAAASGDIKRFHIKVLPFS